MSCKLVLNETKLVKSIYAAGKLFQTLAIRCDKKTVLLAMFLAVVELLLFEFICFLQFNLPLHYTSQRLTNNGNLYSHNIICRDRQTDRQTDQMKNNTVNTAVKKPDHEKRPKLMQ